MKAAPLHINLLRDDERRSANPFRARVMVPMFAGLAALAVLVWSGLAFLANAALRRGNERAREQIEEQASTVRRHAEISARKAALESEGEQLDRFLRGRVRFSDALAALAESLPEDAALTRLDLAYPVGPAPLRAPAKGEAKAPPPAAALRVFGVTTRPEDVETLVAALRSGPATNSLEEVEVPAGSFRADATVGPGHFRFEILGRAHPRAFGPPARGAAKGGPRP